MKEFIKSNYLLFIKIILTIYTLYSLKYLYRLKNIESEFYMNVTFILIIAAVYLLINYTVYTLKNGINKRLFIISLIMGLYFAFAAVLGAYYEGAAKGARYAEVLDFTFNHFIVSLKYIPALWFLFLGCILFIYIQIPKIYNNYISQNSLYTEIPKIFNKQYKIWFFIFICWLPYFILLYPGYMNPDANSQINQIFTGKFNTHHPLLTTLYMLFIPFYYKLSNNGVLTIGLYVIFFQMLPLSFVYAYMITKLKNIFSINRNILLILILFTALFPANPLISITIEKGVLFIIFLILFLVKVIELVEYNNLLHNKIYMLQFVLLGTMLCLTRHNVIYSLFFVLPFLFLLAKNYRKYVLFSFASIFICFIVINIFLVKITDASKGNIKESLSFPIQQIARVYKYNKDKLSENEIKYIESINGKEHLSKYHPKISDPVKSGFKPNIFLTRNSIIEYIKLGVKYPVTYLNSFLILSDSLWYPFNNSFWREGLPILMPANKNLNIKKDDYLKHKYKILSDYLSKTQSFANESFSMFAHIMFNQSIFFYIFFISFTYLIYNKSYKNVFVLMIPLGYTVTLLLSPIIYIRYTYYLIAVFPMIIIMLTNNRNNNEITLNYSEK